MHFLGGKADNWDAWSKAGALVIAITVLLAVAFSLYGWLQLQGYQQTHALERVALAGSEAISVKANQDMAEWTYALLLVGVVSSLLSIAGIVVVGLTLRASRDTVAAAQSDTKATREIGENQNRAYLRATEARLMQVEKGKWAVQVRYHNSGMTPAINIRHAVCIGVKKADAPPLPIFNPNPRFLSRRPIPSNDADKFRYEIPDYSMAVAGAVEPGIHPDSPHAKFLTFIGAVIYEDVFGGRFRTQFEFHFKGTPPTDGGHDLVWGKKSSGGVYERLAGDDRISEAG